MVYSELDNALKRDTSLGKEGEPWWSAYVCGFLYISPTSGKMAWRRKCDLVNSLKYHSDIARKLKEILEEEVKVEHPEWYEDRTNWNGINYKARKYENYRDIANLIVEKRDNWFNEHVHYFKFHNA